MAGKISAADVKRARVTIELDGEEVVLVPSPAAILALSDPDEGFHPLLAALSKGSVQAAARVVVAGLGREGREARETTELVAGLDLETRAKLSGFVLICANGGKPFKTTEERGAENPPTE